MLVRRVRRADHSAADQSLTTPRASGAATSLQESRTHLNWVRLPWRDAWESLIGAVGRVLVLQRDAGGLIVGAGEGGFGAGQGLCLGFPAFPAWRRARGSGLGRQLIGGPDRLYRDDLELG